MRLGWCRPLQDAALLGRLGYDFVEVALAPLGLEDKGGFVAARKAALGSPLPTSAFNTFFPKDIKVVGPDVDPPRVKSYLARVAEILGEAKAEVVVLGSGWARNVPGGWERARAEEQLLQSLSWCADALEGTGCTLAIEPLNRKESNIINSVAEGVGFAERVNRPEIRVLADFYHMDEEREPLETLRTHGEWLAHVHVADTGRRNPGTGSYDYDGFFGHLRAIGYAGMISAECEVQEPEADMRHSLGFMRRRWADAAGRRP
jgi:sugar phosphate isomerase/epimerase